LRQPLIEQRQQRYEISKPNDLEVQD
jgi:hypothetical protein